MNKNRKMKSFEADEDVDRMLERASAKGIKVVHICNEALRRYLREQGYSRKKDQAKQAA